uniref:Uncharacterized protein n=1 Tax=Strigamia maritima TaxID=126957 RepID=T1JFM3_STRMM
CINIEQVHPQSQSPVSTLQIRTAQFFPNFSSKMKYQLMMIAFFCLGLSLYEYIFVQGKIVNFAGGSTSDLKLLCIDGDDECRDHCLGLERILAVRQPVKAECDGKSDPTKKGICCCYTENEVSMERLFHSR